MTLYRVYYTSNGMKLVAYIEVADSLGRNKVKEVRRIAKEEYFIDPENIKRIVKDC